MKGLYGLFLLPFLWVLMGCSDPKSVTDALQRAEALMSEHPDSAWMLLNTLSPDEMGENRTRAHYALLYTQAQDKTYIDETNDSLITIAVDYYRHTDDVRHKFLSHYYQGRVCYNRKDYLSATSCYMEAEQLADEVGDDYLAGLLYGEMGRIYRLYYDYPKSLEAYQKSSEYYERAGKIRHRSYVWYNQSSVYRNMNQSDESERFLRMALESGKEMNDKSLVKFCLGDLVMLHVERNQMVEAKELYAELRLLAGEDYGSPAFMASLVKMYVWMQDYGVAKQCLEKGWSRARNHTDSIALYLSSSKLSSALGEPQKAYQELLRGVSMQNIETNKALQQPVLTAQRDYLSDKLEFEAYKFRMEKRLRMLYILLGSLLLLVVIYVLGRKLRMVKEKARKTIDELRHEMLQMDRESRMKVSSLLQELENKDKTASASIHTLRCELQKQADIYHQYIKEAEELQHCLEDRLQYKSVLMAEVFKNWFASMSKLFLILLQDVGKEENKNKKLRKEVNLLHEKYYEGNKAFREVEKLVDRYHDDAMKHFRREMQWTEEADYRRVCYFFAGFSIQLIAVLMDEKEDSVYQKRHRLRKFLETSNLMHKDLFLLLLSK